MSGPQVAEGYFDDPELTARRFVRLRSSTSGDAVWYLTGDLAYEDAGGRLHHLGRIDHQVKVLGRRVELEDVEAHLRVVCRSESVAAAAWPMEHGSATGIVAFVSCSDVLDADVQEGMRRRVPPNMVPRRVLRLAVMPLTPYGKPARQALLPLLEEAA